MNPKPLTTEQSFALNEARQLFASWRESKTGRPRIPDDLWQAAADLYHSQRITVNKIARSLGLNHTTLKEKISARTHSAALALSAHEESTMFIELPPPSKCSDCVIEIENQAGLKMRMCFRGRADPAVIDLGKYLLGAVP
jgi:transposase-like protein